MSGPSIVAEQIVSSKAMGRRYWRSALADHWTLTKPEVNFLILITTGVGFYLDCRNEAQPLSFVALFNTLLGALLVASGTGTLNQYIEREFDAQMRRTARRPAVSGRLTPAAVLIFGIALAATGAVYLAAVVNLLASVLALLTLLTYLFLYTPLKRRTPLCIVLGEDVVLFRKRRLYGFWRRRDGWACVRSHNFHERRGQHVVHREKDDIERLLAMFLLDQVINVRNADLRGETGSMAPRLAPAR